MFAVCCAEACANDVASKAAAQTIDTYVRENLLKTFIAHSIVRLLPGSGFDIAAHSLITKRPEVKGDLTILWRRPFCNRGLCGGVDIYATIKRIQF